MISRQLKLASAGVGAGANVVMGTVGLAFSDISAADPPEPAPPGLVPTSSVTTGATVVEGTEEQGPATSVAAPALSTTPSTIPPTAEQH